MNLVKFFSSIFQYSRGNFHLIYLLIAGLIIAGVSVAALGLTIKQLIDEGFSLGANLANSTIKFLFFSLLLSCATFLRIFSVNLFSERLCAAIKNIVYKKILSFPIEKYDSDGQSRWINFVTNDVDTGITSININLSLILRNCAMFIGSILLLALNSWKLSLVVLAVVPMIMLIISILGYKLRKKITEMKNKKDELFLHFNETILFIKTVKAFGAENRESLRLSNIYKKILSSALPLFLLRGIFISSMIFLMLISISAVIYIGGRLVLVNEMTIGSLSSFIFQSIIAASSIGGIIESISEITKNRPIFLRIEEILNFQEKLIKKENLLVKEKINLLFKDIEFSYQNNSEKLVISNFTLNILSGEKIAIVGQSGSGKSTIVNLILRFYENYKGEILISDGAITQEIRTIDLNEYRNLLGVIQQDVYLFSGTILQNLTYGCENFDDNILQSLLDKLDMRNFIDSLPGKLNTKIGDKSIQISGGQKQRIGIIRALLRNPKILICDESSSALDNENELRFYNLLFEPQYSKMSVILITHRLSHLDRMNKVIEI